MIDEEFTATAATATEFFQWSRSDQRVAIRGLRECLCGIAPPQICSSDPENRLLQQWGDRIRASRYPVFVVDEKFAARLGNVGVVGLSRLVRSLNAETQCRLILLTEQSNSRGAEETLTSCTGAPLGVLFRDGQPMFRGRAMITERLLKNKMVDMVILVSHSEPGDWLNRLVAQSAIPAVCIGSTSLDARIAIPTRRWGVAAAGSGYRTDGSPISVPAVAPGFSSDASAILDQVCRTLACQAPAPSSDPSQ